MQANDNAKVANETLATLWNNLPDVEDVLPVDESDDVVFNEIREVLKRHHALHRFGLTLLHRHFDISEGECILETTDTKHRRQIIEVNKFSELVGRRTLETQWAFNGSAALVCIGYCDYNQGHRHVHNRK